MALLQKGLGSGRAATACTVTPCCQLINHLLLQLLVWRRPVTPCCQSIHHLLLQPLSYMMKYKAARPRTHTGARDYISTGSCFCLESAASYISQLNG
jgi:hypothetical protein